MSLRTACRNGMVPALCALLLGVTPALGAPASKKAPTPKSAPARGAAKPGAATNAVKPAAPLPAPPAAPSPKPADIEAPVDTSVPPPSLPRASREKMRACAEAWEKKKLATKSGLPMWRDFATSCLTRD